LAEQSEKFWTFGRLFLPSLPLSHSLILIQFSLKIVQWKLILNVKLFNDVNKYHYLLPEWCMYLPYFRDFSSCSIHNTLNWMHSAVSDQLSSVWSSFHVLLIHFLQFGQVLSCFWSILFVCFIGKWKSFTL
jgi:hypothetical protein